MLAKIDITTNDMDNWLLAKKPINGYSCAACESIIGDLRDDTNKFIPWNRMPLRDPGDNIYRKGNGFSKMLQMIQIADTALTMQEIQVAMGHTLLIIR